MRRIFLFTLLFVASSLSVGAFAGECTLEAAQQIAIHHIQTSPAIVGKHEDGSVIYGAPFYIRTMAAENVLSEAILVNAFYDIRYNGSSVVSHFGVYPIIKATCKIDWDKYSDHYANFQ